MATRSPWPGSNASSGGAAVFETWGNVHPGLAATWSRSDAPAREPPRARARARPTSRRPAPAFAAVHPGGRDRSPSAPRVRRLRARPLVLRHGPRPGRHPGRAPAAGLELRPVARPASGDLGRRRRGLPRPLAGAPARGGHFVLLFAKADLDPALWVVAWDGDQVAGVVQPWIWRDENAALGVARGWLEHISVRRPWRGRGLARALTAEALRRLRDAGMTEAMLGVDAANPTGALGCTSRWASRSHPRPTVAPAPSLSGRAGPRWDDGRTWKEVRPCAPISSSPTRR